MPEWEGSDRCKYPPVLEIQVHQHLRRIQREPATGDDWPHKLAMGRLIARALRLQESVIIQTSISAERSLYRLSYLAPALLHPAPITIVIHDSLRQQLLAEIPQIQAELGTNKPINTDQYSTDFSGINLLTPTDWLEQHKSLNMPILIDGADRLTAWFQDSLQIDVLPRDWQCLRWAIPNAQSEIDTCMLDLKSSLFQRPANPYNCYLLTSAEIALLSKLRQYPALPAPWPKFLDQMLDSNSITWGKVNRQHQMFSICTQRKDGSDLLAELWQPQPYILIGNVLDVDRSAISYRQEIGWGDTTSVKFAVSSHPLRLYTPNWMPMPNSRNFQELFTREAINVLRRRTGQGLAVVIVGDTPLKAQTAARLAAEYGSLVRLEAQGLVPGQILVTGWEFWNSYQDRLPAPEVIVVATLPIPSVEDPLIAVQVEKYKQQRRDWFRALLLPIGLRRLLQSIAPVRSAQGLLVILDNRLNHRSYGQQILAALQPCVKLARPEFPQPSEIRLCE